MTNKYLKIYAIFAITICFTCLVACGSSKVIAEEENASIGITENINELVDVQVEIINSDDSQYATSQEKENPPAIDIEPSISQTVELVSPTTTSSKAYYKKQILNNKLEYNLYCAIENGINNVEKKISIPIVEDSSKIADIFEFVRLDNPQLFFFPSKYKIIRTTIDGTLSAMEIEFIYNDSWNLDNINHYQEEINESAVPILSTLSSIDGDYNKVLYLYKYLTSNISYKSNMDYDYTIYGPLLYKQATCEGYAETFQYLLNLAGINTISVVGESRNQPHEWNMAQIDGQWYYFDVTWDCPTNTSKYLPYNYFGLTMKDISKTHDVYYSEYLPEANSIKYNYYYYNDLILPYYSEKEILSLAKKSLTLNPEHISFRTENEEICEKLTNEIKAWVPKVFKEIGIVQNEISYVTNKELNIIDISLEVDK